MNVDPVPSSQLDVPPRIDLRVPGPWQSAADLSDAIAKSAVGYRLREDKLVHEATGRRISWAISEPDDDIAGVFADTGRLSDAQIAEIAAHHVKVHLSGAGGSVEAARTMLDAATALIEAGGFGVLIDSSAACHGRDDWMTLAGDKKAGGLYWAYVSVSGDDHEVWSCGMHCLGLRDAEMLEVPDPEWAGFFLHNFLGYTYQSGVPVLDGEALGDEDSALYRVRHVECTRFSPQAPFHNPYGVWRLEKMDPQDQE